MSSHRKRGCYSFIFPLEIRFVNFSPGLFQEYLFLYYVVHFLASLCQKKSKQNLNSVNRLSNSSLCVVVMFPPKTSVPCARARNDRSWREKRSTRSVYPLPCLPSWSKSLSYRKLPTNCRSTVTNSPSTVTNSPSTVTNSQSTVTLYRQLLTLN